MWPFFRFPVWFLVFSINCRSSQLYLIELLGFLTGLGLLKLWHLIYLRLRLRYRLRHIAKAFDRVGHADLLHKLTSYGISGHIIGLTSSFLSNRQLQVVLDGKSSQEHPVNAGVPQSSILSPTPFLLFINDLPDFVIWDIAIYADDTTLYSKCHLRKPITFASVKVYCLITLIYPIILISHIAQLLLISKFYCFRKGPHISFKYAQHNHSRCPMMGEVSLET